MNLTRAIRDLRNVRCVRYVHNGHDGVAELRGRPAFRALAAYAWLGRRLGGHGRVYVGDAVYTNPCRDEVLFIVMPGSREIADHVEWRRRQPSTPVVVDVTGDVLGLLDESEWSEAGRVAGRSNTATSREWWARPEPRDALTRCLVTADVVTTSWAELVTPLGAYSPHVVHLPDHDPGAPHVFYRHLTSIVGSLTR